MNDYSADWLLTQPDVVQNLDVVRVMLFAPRTDTETECTEKLQFIKSLSQWKAFLCVSRYIQQRLPDAEHAARYKANLDILEAELSAGTVPTVEVF